jgi:hypothetical protein
LYFVGAGLAPALVEQVLAHFLFAVLLSHFGQGQAQPLHFNTFVPTSKYLT